MTSPILVEVEGAIATIILNRPEVGNAIDVALAEALLAAVEQCAADRRVRCLILHGAGRMFCVGGDVQAFAAAGDTVGALIDRITDPLHRAIVKLSTLPKPVVTAINGAAAGAGLGLAILGDVVLAAHSAKFTAGYGALGVTPDAGVSWFLPRLVGLRESQRILFGGERINADEAARIGLVSRVVNEAELMDAARATAERMGGESGAAIGRTRLLLHSSFADELETHLDNEARSIARAAQADEGREGVRAFLEKRRPQFERL